MGNDIKPHSEPNFSSFSRISWCMTHYTLPFPKPKFLSTALNISGFKSIRLKNQKDRYYV